MLKKINLDFYKSLINSDFILLNSKLKTNSNYIGSATALTNSQNLQALDIEQLLKGCKQLIRIVQFIKQNKGSSLRLSVCNKQYFFLLTEFLKTHPINFPINIVYLKEKNMTKGAGINLHLILDSDATQLLTLKQTFSKSLFLVQKINDKIEIKQTGIYKIYNNLFDFKKIIFILILLDVILS